MGSAGTGEKGSETGRQGLGEGRENRNSEEEKYRQKDTYKHTQRMCVSYPLVFTHLPGQFFAWSHLPWVAAFPTLGQDPQPFDPQPGTFCQKQLVSHKFLSSPPGIWSFIWPLNLWEAARGQAKPTNPWSLLTSSLPGSCPHRRWREGEHSAIESSL